MAVVCPLGVAQFGALAVNEVGLVDDGDASLCGELAQPGQRHIAVIDPCGASPE